MYMYVRFALTRGLSRPLAWVPAELGGREGRMGDRRLGGGGGIRRRGEAERMRWEGEKRRKGF